MENESICSGQGENLTVSTCVQAYTHQPAPTVETKDHQNAAGHAAPVHGFVKNLARILPGIQLFPAMWTHFFIGGAVLVQLGPCKIGIWPLALHTAPHFHEQK